MKKVQSVEFYTGSKEERLPDFAPDFPYVASCAELDKYAGRCAPWHWHKAVELFYMESGVLEYHTPKKKLVFPAGSGGMVNSNILHMTRAVKQTEATIQMLHIFEPSFLAGEQGSRIEQKYFMPLITAPHVDIIPLYPDNAVQKEIIKRIQEAFYLPDSAFGYEIRLREALTAVWLLLLEQAQSMHGKKEAYNGNDDKIKQMMIYVHEHYSEKVTVSELAAAAFLSERECFRLFHDSLHMAPMEYLKSYRLQKACQMLAEGRKSMTEISHACGLGSSSYFGSSFREHIGCTPTQYRRKWQNIDK